jgi:hypothetical protein
LVCLIDRRYFPSSPVDYLKGKSLDDQQRGCLQLILVDPKIGSGGIFHWGGRRYSFGRSGWWGHRARGINKDRAADGLGRCMGDIRDVVGASIKVHDFMLRCSRVGLHCRRGAGCKWIRFEVCARY